MTEDHKTSCNMLNGFNFCFWAKFVVAIPALAIAGYAAAAQFEQPLFQLAAWVGTVMLLVWLARKVEALPALQKSVYTRKSE
jgi:hypothetical protein